MDKSFPTGKMWNAPGLRRLELTRDELRSLFPDAPDEVINRAARNVAEARPGQPA